MFALGSGKDAYHRISCPFALRRDGEGGRGGGGRGQGIKVDRRYLIDDGLEIHRLVAAARQPIVDDVLGR